MDINSKASLIFIELVMLAGIGLGCAALFGVFEVKYTCQLAASKTTIAAQYVSLALIFGSVGLLHLRKKRAAIRDELPKQLMNHHADPSFAQVMPKP